MLSYALMNTILYLRHRPIVVSVLLRVRRTARLVVDRHSEYQGYSKRLLVRDLLAVNISSSSLSRGATRFADVSNPYSWLGRVQLRA